VEAPDYQAALGELLLALEDAVELTSHGATKAAVLIPLFVDDDGRLTAIFTKRHADLRRHSGEISFPGGRRDDDEALWQTALREAQEEIGLDPGEVTLVGALPPTGTFVTNYSVYPFVGLITAGTRFRASPAEVDEVIEIALGDLVSGYEHKRLIRRGVPIRTPTYTVRGHLIWGATARIVMSLLERVEPVL
jgi:8-oxo-dGTP pyrophosphatase MutT (NUDIX family)